ncbi:hypothetical protein [Actinomadura rugatobispora]|uniref:Secreted protein n=1 Tax=Actinomadura rugatobispora TaxID=1994 RepID=A0ABW1A0K2_9ACTN
MFKRLLTLAAGVAAAVALTASPAYAAGWTVSGAGGWVTYGSSDLTWTVPASGARFTCAYHEMSGPMDDTTSHPGPDIGSITDQTLTNCGLPFSSFAVTVVGQWRYNAVAPTADPDVNHVSITGVHLILSGLGCTATIIGGVPGRYDNTDGTLSLDSAGSNPDGVGLTFSNVQGCLGLIQNGGVANWTARYATDPPYTLTHTP